LEVKVTVTDIKIDRPMPLSTEEKLKRAIEKEIRKVFYEFDYPVKTLAVGIEVYTFN